jgi:hypothetical protein
MADLKWSLTIGGNVWHNYQRLTEDLDKRNNHQYTGAEWKAIDQVLLFKKNTVTIEIGGWIKWDIEKGKTFTGKFDVEF